MEIAPSLHRVGSDVVASYLVADDTGVTIIDAGLPGDWDDLNGEMGRLGRSLEEVRGIVLTHGDTDHIGYAERLRREHGVPVHVHEADAGRARGEVKKPNTGWGRVSVGSLAGFLWYSARRGGLRIAAVTKVVPFGDGQTLDLPGAPRIIHIPGHTPGSVAIHVPAVDALFVGDALTTRNVLTGETGPRPAPFTIDSETALASLARLEQVNAKWVLPGHGAPWSDGVQEAIRQVRGARAPR